MSKSPSKACVFFRAAAETLGAVASRWPVAICSGALRPEIEYALRRLGRLEQIAAIISAEDTDKCKPDPEGYRWPWPLCRLSPGTAAVRPEPTRDSRKTPLDLAASHCLVVEDSLAGIISAKGAGMRAVGVPNTYTADQLLDAGADVVIDGLAVLTPEWIDRRFAS